MQDGLVVVKRGALTGVVIEMSVLGMVSPVEGRGPGHGESVLGMVLGMVSPVACRLAWAGPVLCCAARGEQVVVPGHDEAWCSSASRCPGHAALLALLHHELLLVDESNGGTGGQGEYNEACLQINGVKAQVGRHAEPLGLETRDCLQLH
jgi:hypothetical protein